MLYDIDLPCIHMILNDRWNYDISEFLVHLSVDRVDDFHDEDRFLFHYEIPDPNTNEEETDEDANEIMLHESVIQENKVYSDPIQHLIYHCCFIFYDFY